MLKTVKNGVTWYAFIDATVSRLKENLTTKDDDAAGRTQVILNAIGKVLGADNIQIWNGGAGQDEIVLCDDHGVARGDVRIVFIIATTHEEPTVVKKSYSWMRYIDLDRLVECGWIPEVHKQGIASANSA